jgi:uncharacterized protein (UPF0548 family)
MAKSFMPRFSKPTDDEVRRFVKAQARLDFTYTAVGATNAVPPPGYSIDRTRVQIGSGDEVFQTAKAALKHWDQYRQGWLELCWPDTPLKPGRVVGVLARAMGLWWLNACRIVYLIDEPPPAARFGFAYGTLPGHAESGEERFLIEHDPEDDSVWYEVLAFSRPRHVLAWLGYPYVRRLQKRFAQGSVRALERAVSVRMAAPTIGRAEDVTQ